MNKKNFTILILCVIVLIVGIMFSINKQIAHQRQATSVFEKI